MEFLSTFAQAFGSLLLGMALVLLVTLPAFWVYDKIDERWGIGVSTAFLAVWLLFFLSLMYSIIVHLSGGFE